MWTVFLTVLSGVITYVVGQLVLKLMLEPIHEMKKTIGQISHSLIEYADVIGNPGVPTQEVMYETSRHFRKLSSQLQAHLYLVPVYGFTAWLFRLPSRAKVLSASKSLMGLSNGVFRATEKIYEQNAKQADNVCDSLSIYRADDERWPREL